MFTRQKARGPRMGSCPEPHCRPPAVPCAPGHSAELRSSWVLHMGSSRSETLHVWKTAVVNNNSPNCQHRGREKRGARRDDGKCPALGSCLRRTRHFNALSELPLEEPFFCAVVFDVEIARGPYVTRSDQSICKLPIGHTLGGGNTYGRTREFLLHLRTRCWVYSITRYALNGLLNLT